MESCWVWAVLAMSLGVGLASAKVPMPLAITTCQAARPDITFRDRTDFHPNQTCGYLTGCVFYAALFGKSPVGLSLDRIDHANGCRRGGCEQVRFADVPDRRDRLYSGSRSSYPGEAVKVRLSYVIGT